MNQLKDIRVLSLLITVLICLTSWLGLFSPEIYAQETELWAAQARGQDLINLYVVPFYLLNSLLINRKENYFGLVWTGISCYFIYNFAIYCFDVRFNQLFLFYVVILALTFYSLVFFLYKYRSKYNSPKTHTFHHQLTGGYFIFLALLFAGLWLSDILPAVLFNHAPKDLELLPTNPVHVLDLSIVLPGFFITGILLIRHHKPGYFLAPVMLTFSVLMQATIVVLMLFLGEHGKNTPPEITWFMFILTLISTYLLFSTLKYNR